MCVFHARVGELFHGGMTDDKVVGIGGIEPKIAALFTVIRGYATRRPAGIARIASGCGNIASPNGFHARALHQSFVGIGPFTFAVRRICAGGPFAPAGSRVA